MTYKLFFIYYYTTTITQHLDEGNASWIVKQSE